jgi:hypothetical protein
MLRCRSVRVEIRGSSVRMLSGRSTFSSVVEHGGDGLLRKLDNAHYQAQDYADDVVLLQKGKFVNTSM